MNRIFALIIVSASACSVGCGSESPGQSSGSATVDPGPDPGVVPTFDASTDAAADSSKDSSTDAGGDSSKDAKPDTSPEKKYACRYLEAQNFTCPGTIDTVGQWERHCDDYVHCESLHDNESDVAGCIAETLYTILGDIDMSCEEWEARDGGS